MGPLKTRQLGPNAAPSLATRERRLGGSRPRLPALDGLRGIGIAAVIVFHLNPSWLPGGYLGVDIFFVVSGFLITGLLLDMLVPRPPLRPALRQFWARRARRLLPGLVVLLFCVGLAASIFAHDAVPELRADIPAALGFVANWRLLLHHDNYFQTMGRPPLLQHLWSLGVEEQFYLVWPFIVIGAVWAVGRRAGTLIFRAAMLGAVGSAILMALLFVPGHDPSNVYYNTFTHASGLLIGAALAGAMRNRPSARGTAARRRRACAGVATLAALGLMLAFLGSGTGASAGTSLSPSFAYRGGIFLASALTGVVLLVSLQPGPVQRLLRLRPLRYLGTRSYSLYLWHWPIICLTRPDIDLQLSGRPLLVLRLALIGFAGEASYRLVEQPFRTGRAQAALRAWRTAARTVAAGAAAACGTTVITLLALVNPPALSAALAAGSTPAAHVHLPAATATAPAQGGRASTAPRPSAAALNAGGPSTPVPAKAGPPTTGAGATTPTSTSGALTTTTTAGPGPPTTSPKTSAPSPPLVRDGLSTHYLGIGDSVMVAAAAALEARLHGEITVDATVGRQVWAGIARLRAYRQAGDLVGLKGLVIDLGTNGPMTPLDVRELREIAAGVHLVVFVNVRVPRPWQSVTNRSLAAVAGLPDVRVVNWYAASAKPGTLWPDGIHPDPKGQAIYASIIARALGFAGSVAP